MSPEELKARARRLAEEVFNQGDLAVADELISPDYIHHVPGDQPAHGLAGIREWVTLMRLTFPDFHVIVEDEIAEGDRVVQRVTARGTHEGELFGVPATGKEVAFDVIEINRVGPDGKFAEHWSSVDLLGLLQQLGALPTPAPVEAWPATRTRST
ncbi:MAG: ester cyclase [Acidimicrobiales bacterium]